MSLKIIIEELIKKPIEENGFELIELKLSQYKKSGGVRIFIDSDNGVRLDDCARISRVIGSVLENSNIFRDGYSIEVSSPGLDRPLQTIREFQRKIGEQVRIIFKNPAVPTVQGELTGANGQYIELLSDKGPVKIDHAEVKMGKIIL